MGALTLKNFSFSVRNWVVNHHPYIDPTDPFACDTIIYTKENKIIKIEPRKNVWLTDKGRQFFDFDLIREEMTFSWKSLWMDFQQSLYIFEICNFKNLQKLLILVENMNLENLSFLSSMSETYPFLKIKRAESTKFHTDLETDHMVMNRLELALASSSLSLAIGINSRYEGSFFNQQLRQRYFKGNFQLLSIGSLVNLTFPVSFLGSKTSIFKFLAGGNHLVCQNFTSASNPLLLTNSEVFKKEHLQEVFSLFQKLKHVNILNKIWNGYNLLNSSLYETGLNNLGQFPGVLLQDFLSSSAIHIINVNLNSVANCKKLLESRLLNLLRLQPRIIIYQNFTQTTKYLNDNSSKVVYLPNNLFFESQETFLNTEGLIKRTTKLISNSKKTDWQILRKCLSVWSSILQNKASLYQDLSFFHFQTFLGFQFYASKTLTSMNFHFIEKTHKFSIFKSFDRLKTSIVKLFDGKFKYWLDDFYTGGKDKFCQNSLTLTRCSTNYKQQITNFI